MPWFEIALCILLGYGFGCIQNAYIVGRLVGRVDIRRHGSGGAGMTNINRTLGSKWAALVFVLDVGKMVAAFAVATWLFNGTLWGLPTAGIPGNDSLWYTLWPQAWPQVYVPPPGLLPGLYAGLGVVLGHNFPFFLKFKGGKGISSSVGLVLMLDWRVALAVYAFMVLAIVLTRYISVASLGMAVAIPLFLAFFGHTTPVIVVTSLLGVLAWVMHRHNLVRLWRGQESKFAFSKKGSVNK